MRKTKQEKGREKFLKWLNGVSFEERISALEKGWLAQCVKCKKWFFSPETDEERNSRKCISSHDSHECFPIRKFVVLERGYVGIRKVVDYLPPMTSEEAIKGYFMNHK